MVHVLGSEDAQTRAAQPRDIPRVGDVVLVCVCLRDVVVAAVEECTGNDVTTCMLLSVKATNMQKRNRHPCPNRKHKRARETNVPESNIVRARHDKLVKNKSWARELDGVACVPHHGSLRLKQTTS